MKASNIAAALRRIASIAFVIVLTGLTACGGSSGGGTQPPSDTTPPTVLQTTPANSATSVALSGTVSADFSESIDPATVTSASFTLNGPAGLVAGSIAYSGARGTFTPAAALAFNTTYTATLSTAVKDIAGNALASTKTWSFTTQVPDTTAPTVTYVAPASGITSAVINATVYAMFSEPVDPATVDSASVTLTGPTGAVAGTVSLSTSGTSVTFTPSAALPYSSSHTAALTTAIKDLAGNPLAATVVWSFQTTANPLVDALAPYVMTITPYNQAVNVNPMIAVTVDFNENLNCATVITGSMTLASSEGPVTGSVSCSGASVVFTPAAQLVTNLLHTVNLTAAITDVAGNALVPISYTFTTRPWTVQYGTSTTDVGSGVTVDGAGNIYVAGTTSGGIDGYVQPGIKGHSDIFLVKYDPQGVKQWSNQLGSTAYEVGNAVVADANGNVYVAGATPGSLDGHTNAGNTDIYLVKYDTNGNKLWGRQLGDTGSDVAFGIALDSSANIYLTGSTGLTLDGQTGTGFGNIFVVKYDTNGGRLWTRIFGAGATTSSCGRAIAVDGSSNIYISGYTSGALTGYTNAGLDDAVLMKLDPSGNILWQRQLGTTAHDRAYGIAVDSPANVYLAGSTAGDLAGTGNFGSDDVVLAKFDTAGTQQWIRQIGTIGADGAKAAATDSAGNVYLGGHALTGFDGTTGGVDGQLDAVVVKYDTSGARLWTRQIVGSDMSSYDIAWGIAIDNTNGLVYVTGEVNSNLDANTGLGLSDFFIGKYLLSGVKR